MTSRKERNRWGKEKPAKQPYLTQLSHNELECRTTDTKQISFTPKAATSFHLLQSPLLFLSLLCVLSPFSPLRLFVTPRTVAHQVPLKMRLSRQEYCSESPCPPPGDLSDPGFELIALTTPALAGGFFTTSTPGKPNVVTIFTQKSISLTSVTQKSP